MAWVDLDGARAGGPRGGSRTRRGERGGARRRDRAGDGGRCGCGTPVGSPRGSHLARRVTRLGSTGPSRGLAWRDVRDTVPHCHSTRPATRVTLSTRVGFYIFSVFTSTSRSFPRDDRISSHVMSSEGRSESQTSGEMVRTEMVSSRGSINDFDFRAHALAATSHRTLTSHIACVGWRKAHARGDWREPHGPLLMRGYSKSLISIFGRKLSIYTPRPALQQRQQALAAMCTPMVPCSRPVTSHLGPAPTSA
jgi:hypothetical protein